MKTPSKRFIAKYYFAKFYLLITARKLFINKFAKAIKTQLNSHHFELTSISVS